MTRRTSLAAAAAALAACAPVASAADQPLDHGAGACDAGRAQYLVGRPSSSELAAEAMRRSGAQVFRWLPEGTIITMEYRADRLNIELDRTNKVKAIRCG